jgi:hypothetical protein
MKSIFKKLEKFFAATAFAEMDDAETAIQIAALTSGSRKKTAPSWDSVFTAVTFAESGCSDWAEDFLSHTKKRTLVLKGERSLGHFLDSIGLHNAPIRFGLAKI